MRTPRLDGEHYGNVTAATRSSIPDRLGAAAPAHRRCEQGMVRARPLQEITLDRVNAELFQHIERLLVLHAFRNGRLVQPLGDGHDRLHEELVVAVAGKVADEEPVDLDRVGLQVLEVGEGREARSEIVQAHAAAGLAQRLYEALRVVQVGYGG